MRFSGSNASNASKAAMTTMHSLIAHAKRPVLVIAALAALAAVPATAGAAGFGIQPGSFTTSTSNTQAGAHADLTTSFLLNQDALGNPVDQLKDVTVNLPSGVVGNPQAIPQCTDREFQNFDCPNDAQVGVLNADIVVTPAVSTTLQSAEPLAPTTLESTLSPCTFCLNEDITVDSTAGIQSGDYLTVGSGASAEQVVVASVVDATTLNLSISGQEITQTHNPGEPVADDVIYVDSTNGFNATPEGDDNLITIGTGANAEQARIEWAPSDAHRLILFTPLTNPHVAGEPVVHEASIAPIPIAVFNMTPDPGHVATLDGSLLIAKINIEIDVRNDGSYGLTANINDISSLLTLGGSSLTLWGVPGDPSHDGQRCGELGFTCGPSNAPQAAFMTNPTNCGGGPLTTTISVDSWQNPDQPATRLDATGRSHRLRQAGLRTEPDRVDRQLAARYTCELQRRPQGPAERRPVRICDARCSERVADAAVRHRAQRRRCQRPGRAAPTRSLRRAAVPTRRRWARCRSSRRSYQTR